MGAYSCFAQLEIENAQPMQSGKKNSWQQKGKSDDFLINAKYKTEYNTILYFIQEGIKLIQTPLAVETPLAVVL